MCAEVGFQQAWSGVVWCGLVWSGVVWCERVSEVRDDAGTASLPLLQRSVL